MQSLGHTSPCLMIPTKGERRIFLGESEVRILLLERTWGQKLTHLCRIGKAETRTHALLTFFEGFCSSSSSSSFRFPLTTLCS